MTLCVACPVLHPGRDAEEYHHPNVCNNCRTQLLTTLGDIARLYHRIGQALIPTGTGGPKVSGSRETPLPINLDVLDLSAGIRPERIGVRYRGDYARQAGGDPTQIGYLPVATELAFWADDIAEARDEGETAPDTVYALTWWLRERLTWTCDHYLAVDEYAANLRHIRGALNHLVGDTPPKPQRLPTPCPGCEQLTLIRQPGQDRVECADPDCARVLTPAEYQTWVHDFLTAQP